MYIVNSGNLTLIAQDINVEHILRTNGESNERELEKTHGDESGSSV